MLRGDAGDSVVTKITKDMCSRDRCFIRRVIMFNNTEVQGLHRRVIGINYFEICMCVCMCVLQVIITDAFQLNRFRV